MVKQIILNPEQLKILKATKKKKRVTCNQFNWWVLDDMVKQGVLDKVFPSSGRNSGWPYFKLSPRGYRYFIQLQNNQQQPQHTFRSS